jgi:YHS domain-containing protein
MSGQNPAPDPKPVDSRFDASEGSRLGGMMVDPQTVAKIGYGDNTYYFAQCARKHLKDPESSGDSRHGRMDPVQAGHDAHHHVTACLSPPR